MKHSTQQLKTFEYRQKIILIEITPGYKQTKKWLTVKGFQMQSWKRVSSRGILISLTKTEAVNNWLVPTKPTELLSFLNYHRDNIQNYADMCAPIYD